MTTGARVTVSYVADLDLARSVVASLGAVEDHLEEVVTDLRWRLANLHRTWTGEAAAAHLGAHRGWDEAYVEMREALAAMRLAVRTARDNYAAAASVNSEMWASVR